MEALYSALEGEISTFVRHMQRCREGFDLHSLYHVLLLVLPRSPSGRVESWQHLQRIGARQCEAALAEELQKSLELEEYHHSILEADWLLELEVRPILMRRTDAVLQRCQTLERVLRGQTLPAPQHTQLRNRMATTCAPGQAQPSSSASAASPWSGQ